MDGREMMERDIYIRDEERKVLVDVDAVYCTVIIQPLVAWIVSLTFYEKIR